MSLGALLLVVLGKVRRPAGSPPPQRLRGGHPRPREVQEALLRRILAYQADTAFGRDHRFRDIRTVADFRRQLPVAGYEYFEPYIARVRRGEINALLADRRVHMFALTSGTTAARKFIPVTHAVPRRLPARLEHLGPEGLPRPPARSSCGRSCRCPATGTSSAPRPAFPAAPSPA